MWTSKNGWRACEVMWTNVLSFRVVSTTCATLAYVGIVLEYAAICEALCSSWISHWKTIGKYSTTCFIFDLVGVYIIVYVAGTLPATQLEFSISVVRWLWVNSQFTMRESNVESTDFTVQRMAANTRFWKCSQKSRQTLSSLFFSRRRN